jgi:hypothetical protein
MQRVLRRGILQAKLIVNQPGDVFEQEADRIAESANCGASCGSAKNMVPMVSIQGAGPDDKSKDAPKGGSTPDQSKAGDQAGDKTPDGLSLGPTDPKKAFCLKPDSFTVKTGLVTRKNFAQGVHIIEFEGRDEGSVGGKTCSCACGVYRQWISGTAEMIAPAAIAQASDQLKQDLQKKGITKAPTPQEALQKARDSAPKVNRINSCTIQIPLNKDSLSEESTTCIRRNNDACKWLFRDQPGPNIELSDGMYVNVQLGFKYEVWDACQGKSLDSKQKKLSIEGSKDPRPVTWLNSAPTSTPSQSPQPSASPSSTPAQPVQHGAANSNAPVPAPSVANKALAAPVSNAWDHLPEPARAVLQHSFDSRDASQCGNSKNPEWMWCGSSAAESFNQLKPAAQSAFLSVYEALVEKGLWDSIARVGGDYSGATRGIEANSTSNSELRRRLTFDSRFCEDSKLTGMLHKSRSWREIAEGKEGLHIEVDAPRIRVHLDRFGPVEGKDKEGYCRISMPNVAQHLFWDVVGLHGVKVFPPPNDQTEKGDVQPVLQVPF